MSMYSAAQPVYAAQQSRPGYIAQAPQLGYQQIQTQPQYYKGKK